MVRRWVLGVGADSPNANCHTPNAIRPTRHSKYPKNLFVPVESRLIIKTIIKIKVLCTAMQNAVRKQRMITLTQDDLTRILPQAYPFLMIDKVIEIKKGKSLVAVKNITGNEWIFQNQYFQLDHLPEPFVIEAAAQAALLLKVKL